MQTLLLIIDVQNDYFPGGKWPLHQADETLSRILTLQHHFRLTQQPIVYVQHSNDNTQAAFFVAGSHGVALHPALNVQANKREYSVTKSYPNSFFQTNLDAILRQFAVKSLVVCGMMTHMCIDATSRAAIEKGYAVTVIDDACTTRDLTLNGEMLSARQIHTAFIMALGSFCEISQTTSWLSAAR